MKPKGSLLCANKPATGLYPAPDEPKSHPTTNPTTTWLFLCLLDNKAAYVFQNKMLQF
jgi:hypothetical protein